MAHAQSDRLGCSSAGGEGYPQRVVYVCNYAPPGNLVCIFIALCVKIVGGKQKNWKYFLVCGVAQTMELSKFLLLVVVVEGVTILNLIFFSR